MPVQVRVAHSQKLVIHFFSSECFCRRLCNNRHFFQKLHLFRLFKLKKLRLVVIFIQEKRVSVKMLVVAKHNIASLQLLYKIRILSIFYHFDSVANKTHFFIFSLILFWALPSLCFGKLNNRSGRAFQGYGFRLRPNASVCFRAFFQNALTLPIPNVHSHSLQCKLYSSPVCSLFQFIASVQQHFPIFISPKTVSSL